MSKKKYRQFSKAFKIDALDLLEHSGKTMAEIERDLGLSPGLLGKWKQRYKIDESSQKLSASDTAIAQKEIQRLKRELEVARMERDILKKALSIFSQGDKKE